MTRENAVRTRPKSDKKQHKEFCPFCGRSTYLLKEEGVCGACAEDPIYTYIQANNARVAHFEAERRAKKRVVNSEF